MGSPSAEVSQTHGPPGVLSRATLGMGPTWSLGGGTCVHATSIGGPYPVHSTSIGGPWPVHWTSIGGPYPRDRGQECESNRRTTPSTGELGGPVSNVKTRGRFRSSARVHCPSPTTGSRRDEGQSPWVQRRPRPTETTGTSVTVPTALGSEAHLCGWRLGTGPGVGSSVHLGLGHL